MISDPLLFWEYVTPSIFGTVIGKSFSIVSPVFPRFSRRGEQWKNGCRSLSVSE